MSFFDELKRRNVIRVAGLYVVGSWLIIQVATTVFPLFELSAGLPRLVIVILAIGFLPALAFAWVFEITPEGLKRESDVPRKASVTHVTAKHLDRIIIVVLVLALGYFAVDKFLISPAREQALATKAREEGRTEAVLGAFAEKSIAVLPFVDLSPARDQEYFSDGLAEELLDLLSKLPELRVTSRSSAFSFKGQSVAMRDIAERLNVAHVLEGSVRKAGNRIRVTAQLVEARTDRSLWSETYDRNLDDIFAVQDEISSAVVHHLKVALLGGSKAATRVDPRAYDLFLQARPAARLHTAEGYSRAVELFQQSLAIDDAYAPAWTGLAYCYRRQANNSMRPLKEGYALARSAVERALKVDPAYSPAYGELSRIALDYDGDSAAAARHLEHAMALDPTSDVLGYAGALAQSLGRFDVGFALGDYALKRDPLNPTLHNAQGVGLRLNGRPDEALVELRKVLELSPGDISAHYRIAEALLMKGDGQGALEASEQEPHEAWRLTGLALANYSLHRGKQSDAALAQLIAKFADSWPYNIAYVYAWRHEPDLAFEFLEKAREIHDPSLSDVAFETFFDNIHGDARWLPMLERLGKSPAQLAAIRFDVKLPSG